MRKINQILQRNRRVEADKAWETSKTRRLIIVGITYIIAAIFLYLIKAPKPHLNALVPALGFLLSTLTMTYFKKLWLDKVYKD